MSRFPCALSSCDFRRWAVPERNARKCVTLHADLIQELLSLAGEPTGIDIAPRLITVRKINVLPRGASIAAMLDDAGGAMKGMSSALLALAFACFSLISLITVNQDWNSPFASRTARDGRLSELGLRFNMQR